MIITVEVVLGDDQFFQLSDVEMIQMIRAVAEPLVLLNFEGAREALAKIELRKIREAREGNERVNLDSHVAALPLSEVMAEHGLSKWQGQKLIMTNALEAQGITTLRELSARSEEEIMRIANIGVKRARLIAIAMERIGLRMADSR